MHDMAESETLALNKTVRRAIRFLHGLQIHLPVSGGAANNTALDLSAPLPLMLLPIACHHNQYRK